MYDGVVPDSLGKWHPARYVALIAALGHMIELPDAAPRICRDPGDDWGIACAVCGQADAIVSGDRDLLSLARVGEIPMLTAAQFASLLETQQ